MLSLFPSLTSWLLAITHYTKDKGASPRAAVCRQALKGQQCTHVGQRSNSVLQNIPYGSGKKLFV